jgi:hypothetical protein
VAETFTVTAVICAVAGVTATLLAGPRLHLVHLAPVVRVAPPVRAARAAHGARG